MTIREEIEKIEEETLSPYAALSQNSRGRDRDEPQCDIRPLYTRDRDRILHCKSFRRLKNKTQVFLVPEGDHYRTRLSHTLEVSQNARTIAKALRLNEDLTEAIALGHDLGHTPFGHAGERCLNRLCSVGFSHSEQSVRIVEVLENDGNGLNLTWEVRDGIRNHQSEGRPATLEGQCVRLSDKIAYINADIDDAIRANLLTEEDLPRYACDYLGHTSKERLDKLIHDVIESSRGMSEVSMSADCYDAMQEIRNYMFSHVYTGSKAKTEEVKADRMIEALFGYYMENPTELPMQYFKMIMSDVIPVETVICDYISGMTDKYCISKFNDYFMPKAWAVEGNN